jgi:hypothetical protein
VRSPRLFAFVLLVAAAACGDLKNASDQGAPTDAGPDAGEGADGSPSTPGLDGAAGDAGQDARPDGGDGAASPVHLVFVTTGSVDGSFAGAGSPWAAADAICASEATANNLTGTFVAWLSYEDSFGTKFNAGTRIPDVAFYLPGTLADAGAPVLVAASKAELLTTGPRVQMDRIATGGQVPQDENAYVTWVWTGTDGFGEAYSTLTCKAWTSAASGEAGVAGNARRIPAATQTDWTTLGGRTCDVRRRFYCFQK